MIGLDVQCPFSSLITFELSDRESKGFLMGME